MDVKVDNCRRLSLEGTPPDLLTAIVAIGDCLKKEGRAILSVTLDGRAWSPENLLELGAQPLTEASEIEVTSEALSTLVDRTLRELEEVLPELPKACHALAAIFQGSTPTEGYEPFQRLAEIWSAVKARELEVAAVLDCPLDEVSVDGQPVQRIHGELNRYLQEAADALQSGDCVLLGDLLEYELAPRARQEIEIVAALRRYVLQPAG